MTQTERQYRNNLRYYAIWFYIGMFQVAVLLYYSLIPSPPSPTSLQHADKIYHFTAYAWLALWFAQLYATVRYLRLGLCLIMLGVIVEILQSLGGMRMFEYSDMLANSLGVLVSLTILSYTKVNRLLCYVECKLIVR